MKKIDVKPKSGFHVIARTAKSEAATMVIAPGDKEGSPTNKHRADQWLFVLDGKGEATIEGENVSINKGTLLEIKAGETHEIRNTGEVPLSTLNFYAPPVY